MPKRNWLPNSPPLPSGKAWEYPPISGKKCHVSKNWLGALKEDPKFIYNILADVGKASNMIQEHTARMEQYLTPEERFTQAVLQDNRPVLEQMKNEGFTPSSRLLESVAANHPTADNLETLHSTFGISLPSMEAEPAMKI